MGRGIDSWGSIGNREADREGGRGGAAVGPSLGGTGGASLCGARGAGGSALGAGADWEGAEIGGSAGAGMVIICP